MVPWGEEFFDEAVIMASILAKDPNDRPGALVGFPLDTSFDRASSTADVVLASLAHGGSRALLSLELAHEADGRTSTVLHELDEGAPTGTLEPSFLRPPVVWESSRAGVVFGEPIGFEYGEEGVAYAIRYTTVPPTAGQWTIQYWNEGRRMAQLPVLPDGVVEDIIPAWMELQTEVVACEPTPTHCSRRATTPLEVTR